jgi:hypothetical protein
MSFPIFRNTASVIFLISIILIPLGLILKPFERPTNPNKYYQPITRNDIEWKAFVYYWNTNGDCKGTNLQYIVGNEKSAYVQTREIVKKWKNQNPGFRIKEVQVRIPDNLFQDAYENGYVPTHTLYVRFPTKFVPSWCNLTDLQN